MKIFKIIILLIFLVNIPGCEKERIFPVITNIKKQISRKSIIIGDSNVDVIKSTKGMDTSISISKIRKSGISSIGLIDLLKRSKIDTVYNTIFVAIGTNDNYNIDYSLKLKAEIYRVFPNTKEIYVIYGTRGWGSVTNKTERNQNDYYNKYKNNGFKIVKSNGYFTTCLSAHTPNSKYFINIVNKINKINGEPIFE